MFIPQTAKAIEGPWGFCTMRTLAVCSKNYRICRSHSVMWQQPYLLLAYCRLIQSQHLFCRLWLWNEENLELKIGSIPLLKVITCLSLLGTGSGERGFSTSQFCWNWWCLRISWVSFMSISNCHFHALCKSIHHQEPAWLLKGPSWQKSAWADSSTFCHLIEFLEHPQRCSVSDPEHKNWMKKTQNMLVCLSTIILAQHFCTVCRGW
jgi:hypothetical protein